MNDNESTATIATTRVLAIVSLLSDDAQRNGATRTFRGRSVLASTLEQLAPLAIEQTIVLAWDDQLDAIRAVAPSVTITTAGPRQPTASMQARDAALRWLDGWRGGLLATSEFDRGFHAESILNQLDAAGCDAALLVNADAALVDPQLLGELVARLTTDAELPHTFIAAPSGVTAMVLRRSTIEELGAADRGPG